MGEIFAGRAMVIRQISDSDLWGKLSMRKKWCWGRSFSGIKMSFNLLPSLLPSPNLHRPCLDPSTNASPRPSTLLPSNETPSPDPPLALPPAPDSSTPLLRLAQQLLQLLLANLNLKSNQISSRTVQSLTTGPSIHPSSLNSSSLTRTSWRTNGCPD